MPRYELVEGSHFKFWSIRRQGKQLLSSWGRIGSDGQASAKAFGSEQLAKQALAQQVARKLREGYAAVAASGAKKKPAKPPKVAKAKALEVEPAADQDAAPVTPLATAAELRALGAAIANQRDTGGKRFKLTWFGEIPPAGGEIQVGDPVTRFGESIKTREPAQVFRIYDRKCNGHDEGYELAGLRLRNGIPVRWQHGFTVGVDSGMFGAWSAGYEPEITGNDCFDFYANDDESRVAMSCKTLHGDGGYPTVWGLDRNHKQVCLLFGDGVEPGVFGLK